MKWNNFIFSKEKEKSIDNTSSFIEDISEKEILNDKFREFSDFVAIIYYIASWFFVGLSFLFTNDSSYQSANLFYLYFDALAIIFIILFFSKVIMKYLKDMRTSIKTKILSPLLEDHLGNMKEYVRIGVKAFAISVVSFGCFIAFWYIIASNFIFPYVAKGSISNDATYQVFRTIPLEELVFRGLGVILIELFIGFFTYVFNIKYEGKDSKALKIIINIIIPSLIIGILFGLYHLPRFVSSYYPYYLAGFDANNSPILLPVWIPILYLSLLGVFLGIIRSLYGLSYSILIHIINNMWSSAVLYYAVLYYAIILL